jgi:hypothetical protein
VGKSKIRIKPVASKKTNDQAEETACQRGRHDPTIIAERVLDVSFHRFANARNASPSAIASNTAETRSACREMWFKSAI